MTANGRIRRNLTLALFGGVWGGVIVSRIAEIIDWRWLWVLAPLWLIPALLLLLTCAVWLAGFGLSVADLGEGRSPITRGGRRTPRP